MSKIELRPYQKECIETIVKEARNGCTRQIIVLPTGAGKCLAKGTPILMFDGSIKRVEDVVVGELLMGPDSKKREVLSLGRGKSTMFDITPVKGDPYRVNDDHILSLKLTRSGFKYPCDEPKIVNINVKDYLKKSKYFKHLAKGYRVGVNFSSKDVPLDPYFLGAWLGDGTSRNTSITSEDLEIVFMIENLAKKYKLFVRKDIQLNNKSSTYHLTTKIKPGRGKHTNPILNSLRLLNVLENKHIPLLYKSNSRNIRIEVLSGYLDTDGHLNHKGYDYISISKILAEDIAFLARSLGLACYIKRCTKKSQNGTEGVYYRGSISGDTSILNCRLPRKKSLKRTQKKDVLSTGIKVTEAGIENYYGFQLDGDGLFLLGDFTVTHNTVVFGHLPSKVRDKGKKTLVLAHREELLTQARDKIAWIDPTLKIGIEQGENIIEGDEDVIIASVPTLGRENSKRILKFNPEEFGLIIIDESHHSCSESYRNVLRHFDVLKGEVRKPNGRLLLGVTATPTRSDHQGLDKIFDKITFSYSIRKGIDEGYLCNIKAFTVKTKTDLSQVHTKMGDFADGELALAVDNDERNNLIIQSYEEIAPNSKALVFATNVEHAKNLSEAFRLRGHSVDYVIGDMDGDKRKQVLEDFKVGKLQVVVNVSVLTEGFDLPSIATIIMARPTKSSVLFSQMVGRGIRLFEGKEYLNLIDFEDNLGKHSVVNLPTLFGVPKNLTSTKPKFITELVDKAQKILDVYPEYDTSKITDWEDGNIDKIVTEVDVFKQAELPEVIKQNSKFSWQRHLEGYKISFPTENGVKESVCVQLNMLEKYSIYQETFTEQKPDYQNGYTKWKKEKQQDLGVFKELGDALKFGDNWISENKPSVSGMLDTSATWRKGDASDKQLGLLKKLGVRIPKEGLSKGQASNLIGVALNNKHKI